MHSFLWFFHYFCFTQEEIDLIKQKAKEQGKSVSRYVIELVAQN